MPRLCLLEDVVLCEHTGTQTEVSNNVSQHVLRIPITDDLTVVLQENIFSILILMCFFSVLYWLFSHNLDVYKCQFLNSFINICISKCYQILKVSPLLQNSTKKNEEIDSPHRGVRSSAGIDLPQRSFEALYSNVFRGTTKGELVSTVWPPAPPKVNNLDLCPLQ